MSKSGISEPAIAAFTASERARFIESNPTSMALAKRAKANLFNGVPMHWMSDWSMPSPLFVQRAKGARFTDVDGHDYLSLIHI